MESRPPSSESWPAIFGSVLLHIGVLALAFVSWPKDDPLIPPPSSVPVSIVSSTTIEAAAPDNPAEVLVTEDAATAPSPPVETPPTPPVPTPPVPTPPVPTPLRPVPPRPMPTPVPTPVPTTVPTPRPTPPKPTPPRSMPAPARPAPRQPEPTLDLSALAQGPRRTGPTRPRAATGQQGAGQAARAAAPQAQASFNRVYEIWNPPCQTQGVGDMRIQMDVTLAPNGRIIRGPTLVSPQSGAVWRAVADGAMQALIASQPFDVPSGFAGGEYRPSFNVTRACANR